MKKITLLLALFASVTLTGCQLTHVEGELDGVTIKASTKDEHHSHGNGNFCPPGQAKKGNC
ncbi:hypothetical protein RJ45_17080 [Photobacterium gaetbulicola]|uniref:Lipoprotein n=1 Tax=Photobacterium gaetbulicola TaxID=1295392 RepID=A0A0B9H108_9GAMM|nr:MULTISPECIES: hypothetical protein [Photobacterium]KHT62527.1 hypothetical protein RJ45_17080 [Photobacterium gaetbulicola]WEM44535.1 hypothetical protein PTW35_25035 [Photobacterium sp. DA100]